MRACDLSRILTATLSVFAVSVTSPAVRTLPGQGNVPGPSGEFPASVSDSSDIDPVGPPVPPLSIPERVGRMLSQAERMSALTSLIVSRRDSVLVENYYRGLRPSQTINVKSVSKTLLSPLVGIAIRDGLLEGVDQPVAELLPDYYEILAARGALDPRKEAIELRHLLSMRTGIETASFGSPTWSV